MLGSDAILRSLEARGRGRRLRDPRRGDPADLRRDRARNHRAPRACAPRAGRRAHGGGLRARVGQGRRGDRHVRARERRTSSPPIADAWMDSTPIVFITGQVRSSHLIGTDAFQETDIDRHHDADRQALVARAGRRRAPVRHEGGVPHRAHGPPRPGARRRRQGRPGGADRLLAIPTMSTCPAGSRRARCTSGRCARRRRRSSRRSGRLSTRAAAC